MPITVMCAADEAGAVLSAHWSTAEHKVYTKKFAVGCVVATREMNGYDDSDFYATYWDAEAGKFVEVMYASTRGWTYPNGAAEDATPEVSAKWEAVNAARDASRRALAALNMAKKVQKGSRVRVIKGRKAPIGAEGTIFWWKEETYSPRFRNGYKSGPDAVKIGISASMERVDGKYPDAVWTYASNVEVILPAGLEAEVQQEFEIETAKVNAVLSAPAVIGDAKHVKCEQHAWQDVNNYEAPLLVPEVSDDFITKYLRTKYPADKGGMASLRKFNGVGQIVIDRAAGVVRYSTSCTLCD